VGTPDPSIAAVSLTSRVLVRNKINLAQFFVKNVYWGIVGELLPFLHLPGYAYG